MKKPIDPNLDNFDNEELPIDIAAPEAENANPLKDGNTESPAESSKPAGSSSPITADDFKMREKQYYHSSSHRHRSSGSHSHSHHSRHSHHSSHSSHSGKKKKNKKSLPVAAKIAIAFLAVILILIIAVVGTVLFLQNQGKNNLTNVTTQTDYEEKISYNGHEYVYNDDIVAIAFIGVDKRNIDDEGSTSGTAGQADANIVAAVDTSTGEVTAIAVPRDTMVEVDLYSENDIFLRNETMQLCLSYAYGNGTDTSATNVTTSLSRILYDVPISKYFALDLNGIDPINDAVGGVVVESLFDFDEFGIKKGDKIHIGEDIPAENYVRTRDMDTINASLNRTARQVQYIKAFAAQLAPAVMNDFSIVSQLYNTASEYSTTNISLSDATYLAALLVSKNTLDFETITIEGEMKPSTNTQYADVVYAEFYPDEDMLMQTVLDTFYTQID